jgi:hypothetical protein
VYIVLYRDLYKIKKMKITKSFIFVLTVFVAVLFYSCDDSGQNPKFTPKGQVSFTHINLKPLDPNIDGLYNLWLGIDSSGNTSWFNLGQFNINSYGQVVDAQGNNMVFTFNGDTTKLDNAKYSTVTIGNDPVGTVLLADHLIVNSDSVSGSLWMGDDLALGNIALHLYGQGYPQASAYYNVSSPTSNNTLCKQGIWFCDSNGNNTFSDGLRLTQGNGWIYEGWLNDESSNSYYSTGRFYDPYNADLDGAGPCAGSSGPPYNKPGQDWTTSGAGCPNITNIFTGNFGVFITIEPENESGNSLLSPFFLKLFYQRDIVSSMTCKRLDNLFNQNTLGAFPRGRLKITN